MNRAGIVSIALAAVITGACGGAEGVSSSPTGPTSTPTPPSSSQPQAPASCVPTNLRAGVTGSSVTLEWSAVNGASEYQVLVGSTPSSSDQLSTNTTNSSYTWTARPGRQYARVQAKCGAAWGVSSNEVEFTVGGSSAD